MEHSNNERWSVGDSIAELPNLNMFQKCSGALYRVQVGAYSIKLNADNQLARVKAAGYDPSAVQVYTKGWIKHEGK